MRRVGLGMSAVLMGAALFLLGATLVFGAMRLLGADRPGWVVAIVDVLVLALAFLMARRSYKRSRRVAETYQERRS